MNYSKNVVDDALFQIKNLEQALQENAKGILHSTMKEEIRQLVKESLNEQDEIDDETIDMPPVDDTDDDDEDFDMPPVDDTDDDEDFEMPPIDGEDDETIDLSGASDIEVLRVFKAMGDEDGIIVKKENGMLNLKDGENEYMVQLGEDYSNDDDREFYENSHYKNMYEDSDYLEDGEDGEDGEDEILFELEIDQEEMPMRRSMRGSMMDDEEMPMRRSMMDKGEFYEGGMSMMDKDEFDKDENIFELEIDQEEMPMRRSMRRSMMDDEEMPMRRSMRRSMMDEGGMSMMDKDEFYEGGMSMMDKDEFYEGGMSMMDKDEFYEESDFDLEDLEDFKLEDLEDLENLDDLEENYSEEQNLDDKIMEAIKKSVKSKGVEKNRGPKFKYGKTTDYPTKKQKSAFGNDSVKAKGTGKAKFEYDDDINSDGFSKSPTTTKKNIKKIETTEASRTLGNGKYWGREGLPKPRTAPRNLRKESLDNEVEVLREKNKEYRSALDVFRTKLNEVAVFNSNLAYATRLFTEHSTKKQEKINILRRFDSVESLKESKSLYQTIKNELGSDNKGGDRSITESIERTVVKTSSTGSASSLIESKTYENPQFLRMKDLMTKIK